MKMTIRNAVTAAAAAALVAAPVAPAAAAGGPCQFLMRIGPGDVVECVHYILVTAVDDSFDA